MKVLYVSSKNDFGAVNFENSKFSVADVAQLCNKGNGTFEYQDPDEDSCGDFFATLIDYKYVPYSEDLIKLMNDLHDEQDYEHSKHQQFYIVPEKLAK